MTTIKDTDYLFLTTRIRALERSLLTRERIERMLDAPTTADAAKVLAECGYPEMEEISVDGVNAILAQKRELTYEDLYLAAPDRNIIDVFKIKYDYHNAKVLLKAEARGIDADYLLVDTGRVPPATLREGIRSSDLRGLPGSLADAIAQARETLGATGDPQLSDFILDRAYFTDLFALARQCGSAFLEGFVRINIDVANLKSVVRTLRMGKDVEFLKGVLFPGGNVDASRIIAAVNSGSSVAELFATSVLSEAAEEGQHAIAGGDLIRFEKLCDNAIMAYIRDARYVAFGEAPLIAYLFARESEATAIRIIMTGRLAGLPADMIRERLRDSYV